MAQRRDALAPVSKQPVISEVQRLVRLAKQNFFIARDLVPENTTGHFMRRSGAKLMARKGCSFSCIQWFARSLQFGDVDLCRRGMVEEPS